MSKRLLIIGFSIVMIIIAIIMMVVAFGFDAKDADSHMPGSRFFPMVTLGLIIIFSLGLIVQNLRKFADSTEDNKDKLILTRSEILRVIIVAASGFAAYVIWDKLGFLPIAGFLIVVIGITLRVRSVWGYIVLAAIAAALYFVLRSLGIPLN